MLGSNAPYCPPFRIVIHDGLADGRERQKRRAHRKLTKLLTVLLAVVLAAGGSWFWWLDVGRAKREQSKAETSCLQTVNSMRSAYNRAATQHDALVAAFNSLDETKYDLDALEPLAGESLEMPPVVDCSVDARSGEGTASRWQKRYEQDYARFEFSEIAH